MTKEQKWVLVGGIVVIGYLLYRRSQGAGAMSLVPMGSSAGGTTVSALPPTSSGSVGSNVLPDNTPITDDEANSYFDENGVWPPGYWPVEYGPVPDWFGPNDTAQPPYTGSDWAGPVQDAIMDPAVGATA